jgi:hypothetical protein
MLTAAMRVSPANNENVEKESIRHVSDGAGQTDSAPRAGSIPASLGRWPHLFALSSDNSDMINLVLAGIALVLLIIFNRRHPSRER